MDSLKLWIARDKDDMLSLYNGKPWKNESTGTFRRALKILLLYKQFPEVTWENSPQQVELKLIKQQ